MRTLVQGLDPKPIAPLIEAAIEAVSAMEEFGPAGRGPHIRFKRDFEIEPAPLLQNLLNRYEKTFRLRASRIGNVFRLSCRPASRPTTSDPDGMVSWNLGDRRCELRPDKAYVLSRLSAMLDIVSTPQHDSVRRDVDAACATARIAFLQEIGDGAMTIEMPNAMFGSIIHKAAQPMWHFGWHEEFGHIRPALADAIRNPLRDVFTVETTSETRHDGSRRLTVQIGARAMQCFDAPNAIEAVTMARQGSYPTDGPHLVGY